MIFMNFYLDFEASRFSNNIIDIGCTAANGNEFKTLVKPVDGKKVDRFITELTGITNEALANAPDADTAFRMLYNFIEDNSDDLPPAYYVYGSSDADFLYATLKHMEDTLACTTVQAIAGNLIDYASVVKKFFVAKSDLALRKVYMLIRDEQNLVQKHDALEDARMLETVVSCLHDKCKSEDLDTIMAMPSQPRPKLGKKAPEIFQKWNRESSPKWEADTLANKSHWTVKCTDCQTGETKYFSDFNVAALWVIRYIARNVSPKKDDAVRKIENALKSAAQNNKDRYGCSWEYNMRVAENV